MRVSIARFRIPDVLVVRRDASREPVLTHPPLLVIEVLSSEDCMSRVQERIDDFSASASRTSGSSILSAELATGQPPRAL
jgi:Uma2 family endonuclease